jgi:hypothetical protein
MFGMYGFEARHYLAVTKATLFNGKTIPVLMICAGVVLLAQRLRKPGTSERERTNGATA